MNKSQKHGLGLKCVIFPKTHHAGQCEQRCLHLGHVAVLKEVVGLKSVMGLQAVRSDGFGEVVQILQLQTKQRNH